MLYINNTFNLNNYLTPLTLRKKSSLRVNIKLKYKLRTSTPRPYYY